jgi:hypothetical protein
MVTLYKEGTGKKGVKVKGGEKETSSVISR